MTPRQYLRQFKTLRLVKRLLEDFYAMLMAPFFLLYVVSIIVIAHWAERRDGRRTQRWGPEGMELIN